jgi:hypothetical protein
VKSLKTRFLFVISTSILLSALAPLHAGGIRIGDTRARQIAKDALLAGKFTDGQCLPFAKALHAKFQAAGIPSKVISFGYETLSTPQAIFGEQRAVPSINDRGGLTGAHAVVAYEDEGRTYVMDNQSWQPTWIHAASPIDMARQFAGMNVAVGAARVMEHAELPMARRLRKASNHASSRAVSQPVKSATWPR